MVEWSARDTAVMILERVIRPQRGVFLKGKMLVVVVSDLETEIHRKTVPERYFRREFDV